MTPYTTSYSGPIQPIPTSTGPLLFRPATWMIPSHARSPLNPWLTPAGRACEYSSGKATQVYGDMGFRPSKSGRERGRGRGRGECTGGSVRDERTVPATNGLDVQAMDAPIDLCPTPTPTTSPPDSQSGSKPRRPVRSCSTLAPELTRPSVQTGPILMSGFPPLCTSPSPSSLPHRLDASSRKNNNSNKKNRQTNREEKGTWTGEGEGQGAMGELDVSKLGLDDHPPSLSSLSDRVNGFPVKPQRQEEEQEEEEQEEEGEEEGSYILNPITQVRRSASQTSSTTRQNVPSPWHGSFHHSHPYSHPQTLPLPLPLRSYHTSPLPLPSTATSKKGTKGTKGRSRPYEHLSEMYVYSRVPCVSVGESGEGEGEGKGGEDRTGPSPGPGPGLGLGLGREDEGSRGTKDRLRSKLTRGKVQFWGKTHKAAIKMLESDATTILPFSSRCDCCRSAVFSVPPQDSAGGVIERPGEGCSSSSSTTTTTATTTLEAREWPCLAVPEGNQGEERTACLACLLNKNKCSFLLQNRKKFEKKENEAPRPRPGSFLPSFTLRRGKTPPKGELAWVHEDGLGPVRPSSRGRSRKRIVRATTIREKDGPLDTALAIATATRDRPCPPGVGGTGLVSSLPPPPPPSAVPSTGTQTVISSDDPIENKSIDCDTVFLLPPVPTPTPLTPLVNWAMNPGVCSPEPMDVEIGLDLFRSSTSPMGTVF